MELCPCGSEKTYGDCCGVYIDGDQCAPTAEALMRSRYTAYTRIAIDYIYNTTHSSQRDNFDRKDNEKWAQKTDWQSLEIVNTIDGGAEDDTGVVEFIAQYREKGKPGRHHEIAEFRKEDGCWYFYDGRAPKIQQVKREGPKIGRNDPCPCGSSKKYKKCCG